MRSRATRRASSIVLAIGGLWLASCTPLPLSWSPDSSKVAFVRQVGQTTATLWIGDVATGKCTKLYGNGRRISTADWTPDSKRVAVLEGPATERGPLTLVTVGLGGECQRTVVQLRPRFNRRGEPYGFMGSLSCLQWRAAQEAVALLLISNHGTGLFVVGAKTGKTLWHVDDALSGSWSPDGKWLAAVCVRHTGTEEEPPGLFFAPDRVRVGVFDAGTGKNVWWVQGLSYPFWSPDGRCIAAVRATAGRLALVLLSPGERTVRDLWSCSRPEKQTEGDEGRGFFGLEWGADGKSIWIGHWSDSARNSGLWQVDAVSGKGRCLSIPKPVHAVSFSAGGGHATCVVRTKAPPTGGQSLLSVVTVDLATGQRRTLAQAPAGVWKLAHMADSPDGRWVAYSLVSPPPGEQAGEWGVVHAVRRDGTAHRTFYTSDVHMADLIAQLIARSRQDDKPRLGDELRREARRLADELPTRFPDSKLRDRVRGLRRSIEPLPEPGGERHGADPDR